MSMHIQTGEEEERTRSRDTMARWRTFLDDEEDDDDDDEVMGKNLIEITDPTTLDLLLIFGKPFVLSGTFWRAATSAMLLGDIVFPMLPGQRNIALFAGAVMGLLVLGFFNAWEKVLERWIQYHSWYEPKVAEGNMKVGHNRRLFSAHALIHSHCRLVTAGGGGLE